MPPNMNEPNSGIFGSILNRKSQTKKTSPTPQISPEAADATSLTHKTLARLIGLLLIIAALIGLSYKNFYDSSQNIAKYNHLTFLNTALSDLSADLYAAAYNSTLYFYSRNPQNLEQTRDLSVQAIKRFSTIKDYLDKGDNREMLTDLSKKFSQLNSLFLQLERAALNKQALSYTLDQETTGVLEAMENLHRQSLADKNYALTGELSEIRHYFFIAHTNILKYMQNQSPELRGSILTDVKECAGRAARLAPQVTSATEAKLLTVLRDEIRLYAGVAQKIESAGINTAFSLTAGQNLLNQLFKAVALLNNNANEQLISHADKVREDNSTELTRILLIGSIALPLGVALALGIAMSLSRILAEISKFVQQLAAGNFNARITLREKGKINLLINSVQQIPEILQKMQTHTDKLATEIAAGHFRNRLDEQQFPGSFARIAAAINKVCESYVSALDSMPSTLFTCDAGMAVLFTNKAGKELTGRNSASSKYYDFFSAGSIRSFSEYGTQALRQDGAYSGEEIIFPGGNKMNVQLTTRSIKDSSKNIVGFLGLILDLTEIRRRELVMFNVAGKARVITERLAEAASRISGQVEQIASGAEEQRKRTHYTAVALAQMNDAIFDVAQNAETAAGRAENTYACAAQGSLLVNRTTEEINSLREASAGMKISLWELERTRSSVASIISDIHKIVEETGNTAQAALKGKGAPSPASEKTTETDAALSTSEALTAFAAGVNTLTDKNKLALNKVEENIIVAQGALKRHVREVEKIMHRMKNLSELATASEKSLQDIVALATESSSLAVSIASAAEEQSNTSMRIHPVMDSINSIAAEAAENAASVAESVQNLAHITNDLREIMRTLK